MKLTKHFTLQELTHSDIAQRHSLDNTPDKKIIPNLIRVAELLEDVRALFNKPIIVNSGYRSVAVNALLGSKPTSQHCIGCAADIRIEGLTPDEIVKKIVKSDIQYDQVIREFDSWVHISIPKTEGHIARKNALIIDKNGTRNYDGTITARLK
jgi:zinc D-Ala-D-Ala carboxypeptidase